MRCGICYREFPVALGGGILLALVTIARAGIPYVVVDMGSLPGSASDFTEPFGINNRGQAVGYGSDSAGQDHAFVYAGGTITAIPTPGWPSDALGINDSGDIVGCYGVLLPGNVSPKQQAFLYRNGTMTNLGTLGGDSSVAEGINSSGWIVGGASGTGNTAGYAFLYRNGSMTSLGALPGDTWSNARAINSSGQVVGNSDGYGGEVPGEHAFLYRNGTMINIGRLPGATNTNAYAINDSGQTVGYSEVNGHQEAFLYSDGTMIDLGSLGGVGSGAVDINNVGQVLGNSKPAAPTAFPHPFLYSNGTMADLQPCLDSAGWYNCSGRAINDLGWIVGIGDHVGNSNAHGFLMKPALAGDANLDGLVDATDLNRLLTNYNHTATTWADGDFDENATIDAADLNKLLTNYNHSTASAGPHSVPEPSTVILAFTAAAIALFGVSRRRCD